MPQMARTLTSRSAEAEQAQPQEGATAALSAHLIPYLVGRGYSPTIAATVIGWMGAVQLPGRLLFVPISARLGARVMVAAVFVAQALGIGQLPLLGVIGTLIPFILLQGAANGMATLARATSLVQLFGARHCSAIVGAGALGANGAQAIGPVGSYPAVFWLLAVSLVMAAAVLLASGARPANSVQGSGFTPTISEYEPYDSEAWWQPAVATAP